MTAVMKVRSVCLAFVSTVYLAALGANSGSVFATTNSVNPLTSQAYQALTAGDSKAAIGLYSEAIDGKSLAPEMLVNALLNRGLAYQQQQKHDQAVADYTSALTLDVMAPDLRATALYNRGLSQQKLGTQDLAIEDFTNALLINSTFSHAYLSRGIALKDSGQLLFALSDFDRALQNKHPDPARVYFSQAQTYELLHRPLEQKQMLEAALSANPKFEIAQSQLAALNGVKSVEQPDEILTASIAPTGGMTVMHKPDLPKAMEPTVDLASGEQQPKLQKSKKIFTDRIAPEAEIAVEETVIEPAKKIVLDSVPEIPVPIKKPVKATTKTVAPMVKAEAPKDEASDSIIVASITPTNVVEGWSVQLASAVSEDAAWTTWKNMQKTNKALAGIKPVVIKADLGVKGIFYRVRLAGFDVQKDAQSACQKLKSKGVACYASK
jgi:tetratricopeptide (TPR) repeat protein